MGIGGVGLMEMKGLLCKLGWPQECGAREGLARWSAPSADGDSTLEAAIGLEDGALVAIISHMAKDGHVEGLVRIEAKVEQGVAVAGKSLMGDPPFEVGMEEAASLFAHMRSRMGAVSFQALGATARPESGKVVA